MLTLFKGLTDLRSLDKALVSFTENQGLNIVAIIQEFTQEIKDDRTPGKTVTAESASLPESTFSPNQLVLQGLRDAAIEVDDKWKSGNLNEDALSRFAAERKLKHVAVLNARGDVVFQNRNITADEAAKPKTMGKRETRATLNRKFLDEKLGFLELLRKNRSGSVIVAVDRDGLYHWVIKESLRKVIEEIEDAIGHNFAYVVVLDRTGKAFVSVRPSAEIGDTGTDRLPELFSGRKRVISRKTIFRGKSILDVTAPLFLDGKVVAVVRLGYEREDMDKMISESKRNLVLLTAPLLIALLLCFWIIYRSRIRKKGC